jgi:nucleotide-binding universal stress UspA family protein
VGEVQEEHEIEARECRRWLKEAIAFADEQRVTAVGVLRVGRAGQVLPHLAGELRADLLVIGNSGRSPTWRHLLGSTAEQVSRHAPGSVLIVRAPSRA